MSLEKELSLVKTLALQTFNDQFGTKLKASEMDAEIRRPQGQELFVILFTTKITTDETRFSVAVTEFGNVDTVGKFQLRLRPNGSNRNAKDEIFVSPTRLYWANFKFLQSHVRSSKFEEAAKRDIRLATKTGDVVELKAGLPVQTQA